MSDMTSQEKLTQARNSVDDIAQIREGRTVSLAKYRNIGIMAHIDAVFDKYKSIHVKRFFTEQFDSFVIGEDYHH